MPARSSTPPASRSLAGAEDPRLSAALVAAACSAVLLIIGVTGGVVDHARAAYASGILLAVLAVLPAGLAIALAFLGRRGIAAGVLAGSAVIAVGRMVADAQFAADPSLTARPELLVPEAFELAPSWPSLALLLAGHAALVVAGVLAAGASGSAPDDVRAPFGSRQHVLVAVTGCAAVIAFGLMLRPFSSDDAALTDDSPLDGPWVFLLGVLLIAAAALVAVSVAATARSWAVGRGVLLGVALGVAAFVLPGIVGGLVVPWMHVTVGPLAVAAGAAGLAVVAGLPARRAVQPVERRDAAASEVRLPASRVLYALVGVLALVSAACAIAGARAPFVLSGGRSIVDGPLQPLLFPTGLVVGALGVAVLVPALTAVVRPALSVVWVAVLSIGTGALARPVADAGLPAETEIMFGLDLPVETELGAGVVLTTVALAAALLLAACSVIAGVVERESAELPETDRRAVAPAIVAGVLAVGTFALPVVTGEGYEGTSVTHGIDVAGAGALVALLVVGGALGLVPRSRPVRALALLGGAIAVVVLRLLELPLAGGRVDGASAGAGTWFGVACLLALAATAALCAVSAGRKAGR